MDTGLINFIESFLNKDVLIDIRYNLFLKKVPSEKAIEKKMWFMGGNGVFENGTYSITLDKDDLNYLYNKYYPKYKEEVIKRDEELKIRKEKEIKELEDKLKKLRNE